MLGIRLAVQSNDLNNAHLQQLIHSWDLVEDLQNPLNRLGHGAVRQENECVAFACRVGLGGEERLDQLGCVGYEVLEFLVYGIDGEYGVLAHIRVSVLEAGATDGDEGLKNFDVFRDLLQESECCASYVFVWMLLNYGRWMILLSLIDYVPGRSV